MNLSQVPIHQRLDALLEKFDDNEGEEDNFDYLDFVNRRAQRGSDEDAGNANDDGTNATGEGVDGTNTNDAELDDDFDAQWSQLQSNRASTGRRSLIFGDDESNDEGENEENHNQDRPEPQSPVSSPPSSAPSTPSHNDVVKSVYKDAGISPLKDQTEKQKRKTSKQVQMEMEKSAREHQEMERMFGEDIGAHTVKSRTVNSFLASLSDDEDGENQPGSDNIKSDHVLPGDTQEYNEKLEKERFKELVSSPPKMQGLRSFITRKSPPPQAHHLNTLGENNSDSDSDLEVIPETKTNRLSRPVKDLLKFSGGGGGTPSDRKLAQERQKLLNLQRQQIAERKRARLDQLKEHGVNVDAMVQQLDAKRQQNSLSGQALLDQERQSADKLREAEHSGGSESELEFEDEPEQINRAKKVLSDSEDEEGDDFIKTERDPRDAEADADANTDEEDEDNRHIGRTGTQYVSPLPQHALAEMLGNLNDDQDSDGTNDSHSDNDDPVASAAASTAVSPTTRNESLMSDDLNIVGDQNEMRMAVQPDLSDLKNNQDLTLSQHLAEVRQRFLQAQAEQRRKESIEKRNSKNQQFKSMFVEDQAEESDDEENGGGIHRDRDVDNDDDNEDEDPDAELQGLVDHNNVAVKEDELKRRYLEEEKLRDQRMLNKLVDGVHGGFRRRHKSGQENQFLSDDDMGYEEDEADEQMREYLRKIESRRKSHLLSHNAGAVRLASNARASAFFTSISEDLVSRPVTNRRTSVKESLDFLRSVAEKDNETLPEPQPLELDVVAENAEGNPMHDKQSSKAAAPPVTHNDTLGDDAANNTALPKVDISLRRVNTLRMPERMVKRGSTYASRISATDLGNAKTVEIMQSLGRPSEPKKPKKRFVAPKANPEPKRPRHLASTAAPTSTKSGSLLFKRSWA